MEGLLVLLIFAGFPVSLSSSLQNPNDFAIGRATVSSSYFYSLPPSLAVNGDSSDCFQSDEELQPWWMVDLGEGVAIGTVSILPAFPLSNNADFMVYVSNIRGDWRSGEGCVPMEPPLGYSSSILSCVAVAGPFPMRYLYVVSKRPALEGQLTSMRLCDVQVSRLGPTLPQPRFEISEESFSFTIQGDSFDPTSDAVVLVPAEVLCGSQSLAMSGIEGYRRYLTTAGSSSSSVEVFSNIRVARRGVYKVCWCSGAISDCQQASSFNRLAALVFNLPAVNLLSGMRIPWSGPSPVALAEDSDTLFFSDAQGLKRLSLESGNSVLVSNVFALAPGIAVSRDGLTVYAIKGHAVFKISVNTGVAEVLVGRESEAGFAGDYSLDSGVARLNRPGCLALDERRMFLFICDQGNKRIRVHALPGSERFGYTQGVVEVGGIGTVLGGGKEKGEGVRGEEFDLETVYSSGIVKSMYVGYGRNGVDELAVGLYVVGGESSIVRLQFINPNEPVGVVQMLKMGGSEIVVQDSLIYTIDSVSKEVNIIPVREYAPLGCYRERQVSFLLELVSSEDRTQLPTAIDQCAEDVGESRVFGIREGGACACSQDAVIKYSAEGQSSTCVDGRGSAIDNSIYSFTETGVWTDLSSIERYSVAYGNLGPNLVALVGPDKTGNIHGIALNGDIVKVNYYSKVNTDLVTLEEADEQPPNYNCLLCSPVGIDVVDVRYSDDCTRLLVIFNHDIGTAGNSVLSVDHKEFHPDPYYLGFKSTQNIHKNVLSIELGLYPSLAADTLTFLLPSKRVLSFSILTAHQCQGEKFPIRVSAPPVFGSCGNWRAVLEDGVRISGRAPKSIDWICIDSWPMQNLCSLVIQPMLDAKAWCGSIFKVDSRHAQLCETVAEIDAATLSAAIASSTDNRFTFQVRLVDWRDHVYTSPPFSTQFVQSNDIPYAMGVGANIEALSEGTSVRFEVASRSLYEECGFINMALADLINEHVEIEWRVARKPVSLAGELVTSVWSEMVSIQSAGTTKNVGIFDLSKLPSELRTPGTTASVVALVSYTTGKSTGVQVSFQIEVVDKNLQDDSEIVIFYTPTVGSNCPVVVDATAVSSGRPDLAGIPFMWSCVGKTSGTSIPACAAIAGPVLVLAPGTFPAGTFLVRVSRGGFQRTLEVDRYMVASLPLETVLIPDLDRYDIDASIKLLSRGNSALGNQCVWTPEEDLSAKYSVGGQSGFERVATPEKSPNDVGITGVGFRLREFRTNRQNTFTKDEEMTIVQGASVDLVWGSTGSFVIGLRETSEISAGEISVFPEVAETAETYVLVQQAWTSLHNAGRKSFLYGTSTQGEQELLLDFRSGRTQYVPLLKSSQLTVGSVVTQPQGDSLTTVQASSTTIRDAPPKARDPSVTYDLLSDLDDNLTNTLVKIQTIASLNLPRLQALLYEEYAIKRLPNLDLLQETADARQVSNKALMTVRELLFHLTDALGRLETGNMLHVGMNILVTVHQCISDSGFDDLALLIQAVDVVNTYLATLARLQSSINTENQSVNRLIDLISEWILPRLVEQSDFVGAAHGEAGQLTGKLVSLIHNLATRTENLEYVSSSQDVSIAIGVFADLIIINLPAVTLNGLTIREVNLPASGACNSVKRTVYTWTYDLYSYSRYNSSDALFGAFTYSLTSACGLDFGGLDIQFSLDVPHYVQELAERPAYTALMEIYTCVTWDGMSWNDAGCSSTYDATSYVLHCSCPRNGDSVLAGRLVPYPFDLEPRMEVDFAVIHNALTYFASIFLGVTLIGAFVRLSNRRWIRRQSQAEYLVDAATRYHRHSLLKSRTRGPWKALYDCVIKNNPRFFTPHILELQLMRTGSREDAYKKFDIQTAGRVQPELLALLWEAPLHAVTSMEAVHAETVTRKKDKLLSAASKQAQLMMGVVDEHYEHETLVIPSLALVPTKTASDEYSEIYDPLDPRQRLIELQHRDARFQAAQTFKGIRKFAVERHGEKPGTHTGQNWEESMMLVKAKFNGNPDFAGAFANSQIPEKDLNARYPVVKSLLWTTWSLRDFLMHFLATCHPVIGANTPVKILTELAIIFLGLGVCSCLCFVGGLKYPSHGVLPNERSFGDVLADISRVGVGVAELFVGPIALISSSYIVEKAVIRRFLTPIFRDREDFDAAIRRWERNERRGKTLLVSLLLVGLSGTIVFGLINPQINAGRAVVAFLFGLALRWILWPIGQSVALVWIFKRSKWSGEWDGVLGLVMHLVDSISNTDASAESRQRIIDEEFLADVHWERLHPRLRAEFRRFTREITGGRRDYGEPAEGHREVLSDGEQDGESE